MSTKPPPPNNPFAKLQALRNPDEPPPAAKPASPAAPAAKPEPKGPAWAVIRMERKGRGGKEATIVEKLALSPKDLALWCKDLKQALGCGGAVEGDTIVLQGDLRSRLEAVLLKRGVRKVTVG